MRARPLTKTDKVSARDGTFTGLFDAPQGMEDYVVPVEALIFDPGGDEPLEISVPWEPDEIDVAALAHGGTVWLTAVGGLMPHRIEVRPKEPD
jgi:hypothetical protein